MTPTAMTRSKLFPVLQGVSPETAAARVEVLSAQARAAKVPVEAHARTVYVSGDGLLCLRWTAIAQRIADSGRYRVREVVAKADRVWLEFLERDQDGAPWSWAVRCESASCGFREAISMDDRSERPRNCRVCTGSAVASEIPHRWRWLGDSDQTLARAFAAGALTATVDPDGESYDPAKDPMPTLRRRALVEGARAFCSPIFFGVAIEGELAPDEAPAPAPAPTNGNGLTKEGNGLLRDRSGEPVEIARVVPPDASMEEILDLAPGDGLPATSFRQCEAVHADGINRCRRPAAHVEIGEPEHNDGDRRRWTDALDDTPTKAGPRGLLIPLPARKDGQPGEPCLSKAIDTMIATTEGEVAALPPCSKCGGPLLFSARERGNGLCGPCTRAQTEQPAEEPYDFEARCFARDARDQAEKRAKATEQPAELAAPAAVQAGDAGSAGVAEEPARPTSAATSTDGGALAAPESTGPVTSAGPGSSKPVDTVPLSVSTNPAEVDPSAGAATARCESWCSYECCGGLSAIATRCGRPRGHEGRHACPTTRERDPRHVESPSGGSDQSGYVEFMRGSHRHLDGLTDRPQRARALAEHVLAAVDAAKAPAAAPARPLCRECLVVEVEIEGLVCQPCIDRDEPIEGLDEDDAAEQELRETSARVEAGEACPSCFGVLVHGKCQDEGCDVDVAAEWIAEQERSDHPNEDDACAGCGELARDTAKADGSCGTCGSNDWVPRGSPLYTPAWKDEPALEGRDPRRDPIGGDIVEWGPLPEERAEVLAVTAREPQEGAHPSHDVTFRAGGVERVLRLGAWRARFNALVPAGPDRGRVVAVTPGRGPIEEKPAATPLAPGESDRATVERAAAERPEAFEAARTKLGLTREEAIAAATLTAPADDWGATPVSAPPAPKPVYRPSTVEFAGKKTMAASRDFGPGSCSFPGEGCSGEIKATEHYHAGKKGRRAHVSCVARERRTTEPTAESSEGAAT